MKCLPAFVWLPSAASVSLTIDACSECDFRRLEWVIFREGNVQKENTTSVGTTLGTHDRRHPLTQKEAKRKKQE